MNQGASAKEKLGRRRFVRHAAAVAVGAIVGVVGYYYWYRPKKTEEASRRYTVSLVNDAVNLVEQKGEECFPEFRERGSRWFSDEFYIFVLNVEDGRLIRIVYPPDTAGEGIDISNLEDIEGKPIGKLLLEVGMSEVGEGWIEYKWPPPPFTLEDIEHVKPSEHVKPWRKHTFIKRTKIRDEIFLVGSGYYSEDW